MRYRSVFSPAALALLAACASDPVGVETERGGTGTIGSGLSVAPVPGAASFSTGFIGSGHRVEEEEEAAAADSPFMGGGSGGVQTATTSEEEDSPAMGGSTGRTGSLIGSGN